MALDLADDRRDREGREIYAPVEIEAVDCLDEADRAHLNEVVVLLASLAEPTGERLHEWQVLPDHPLARTEVTPLAVLAEEQPSGLAARERPGVCSEQRDRPSFGRTCFRSVAHLATLPSDLT